MESENIVKNLIIGILIGITIGMVGVGYAYDREVKIYTDEETHIQYLMVVLRGTGGGVLGVGICPRYTSSGNLYYVGSKIVE